MILEIVKLKTATKNYQRFKFKYWQLTCLQVRERNKRSELTEQIRCRRMNNNTPTTEQPGLPRLAYTMRETAKILGVSYATVHRWIKCGLLKCSSASRHKLIPRSEIERFLKDTLE